MGWWLFNRDSTAVTLRPEPPVNGAWRADQALTLPSMSALTPPGPRRDPEASLVDGFHVHMDHPADQAAEAEALRAQYTAYAGEQGLYYTDLDAYPPGANGPHVLAGWEVKFEKAGATVLERYGATLAWMLLNHRSVPVYSHAKTWYLGENEERLRAHTDYALHMGRAPALDLAFFCDPQRGLMRWDAHLPEAGTPSPAAAQARCAAVLQTWFAGDPSAQQPFWFAKQAAGPRAIDATLRAQFLRDLPTAALGGYASWLATPAGKLAYVLLLDQFPRNIFRGTPAAFAYDHLALKVAKQVLNAGEDRALPPLQRLFFCLPLLHSERLEDQDRGVACIAALHEEAPAELKAALAEHLRMARLHQQAVQRFGRLPSRNAILKRESTAEELAFLEAPDHSF